MGTDAIRSLCRLGQEVLVPVNGKLVIQSKKHGRMEKVNAMMTLLTTKMITTAGDREAGRGDVPRPFVTHPVLALAWWIVLVAICPLLEIERSWRVYEHENVFRLLFHCDTYMYAYGILYS